MKNNSKRWIINVLTNVGIVETNGHQDILGATIKSYILVKKNSDTKVRREIVIPIQTLKRQCPISL